MERTKSAKTSQPRATPWVWQRDGHARKGHHNFVEPLGVSQEAGGLRISVFPCPSARRKLRLSESCANKTSPLRIGAVENTAPHAAARAFHPPTHDADHSACGSAAEDSPAEEE